MVLKMDECNCTKNNCNCGCQHVAEIDECSKTAGKIEELLRDELCAEASLPIRQHLAQCSDCNDEMRVCAALTEAVQRGCREKAPLQLRDSILEALAN